MIENEFNVDDRIMRLFNMNVFFFLNRKHHSTVFLYRKKKHRVRLEIQPLSQC